MRVCGTIIDPNRDLGLARPATGAIDAGNVLLYSPHGQYVYEMCSRPHDACLTLVVDASPQGRQKYDCGSAIWTHIVILGSYDPQLVHS